MKSIAVKTNSNLLATMISVSLFVGVGAYSIANLQQPHWNNTVHTVAPSQEAEFLRLHSDNTAEMPEIIVTPDCTFNRYQAGSLYYLFTGGVLVRKSVSPDMHVRKYCPIQTKGA